MSLLNDLVILDDWIGGTPTLDGRWHWDEEDEQEKAYVITSFIM